MITMPWDAPDLPPRDTWADRCRFHQGRCAYRDDDPGRCALCHSVTKCTCPTGPFTLPRLVAIRELYAEHEYTPAELCELEDIPTRVMTRILGVDFRKITCTAGT